MLNIKILTFRSIAWKAACLFLCAFLIVQNEIFAGENQQTTTSGSPAIEAVSNENARVLILTENINSAIAVYARLLAKDSNNVSLSSEYAYALALNGIYDAAIVRLDRIWNQKANNNEVNYFASQIFALMGYDQLAGEFWKESEKNIAPSWISAKAPELLQKRKRNQLNLSASGRDELVSMFKHANRMTAQNFNVQSILLFEEITNQYPNEYLPYVGYSIALEKAGLMEKSAQTIETAIQIVGDNPEQKDTKEFLDKRLVTVKSKINAQGQNSGQSAASSDLKADNGPALIAYAGGFIAKSYTSLNARFGNYLSKSAYVSADLGLTSAGGMSYVNVGLSGYYRQGIFVEGFGISAALGNNTTALFGKISVGVSFMNKNRTSSLDIFLDGKLPLTKGGVTTVGLSVGQSIYFGKRK
jgi:tetratricopeptide (TPR) repeat protein